jgi:hypothetical protein
MRAIFGRIPGTITLNYLFELRNTKVSDEVHYFCLVSSPFDKLSIAEVYKNIYIAQKCLVEDVSIIRKKDDARGAKCRLSVGNRATTTNF